MKLLKYCIFLFTIVTVIFCSGIAKENFLSKVTFIPIPKEKLIKGYADHVFLFENFPIGEDIMISSSRRILENVDVFKKFAKIKFDENGLLIENDNYANKIKLYGIDSQLYAKGEEVIFRFCLINGEVIAETKWCPRPVHIVSSDRKFTIDAFLEIARPFTNYIFLLKGFKENELIRFATISGDEIIENEIRYKESMMLSVMPGIEGKTSGEFIIKVTNESGEKVEFTLPWGAIIFNEILSYYDRYYPSKSK